MFCQKCGNNLPDTAAFCGKCGASVSNNPIPVPVKANARSTDFQTTKQKYLSMICAGLGVIAMFMPFATATNYNYSFSLSEIASEEPALIIPILAVVAACVLCFIKIHFIVKIIPAIIAILFPIAFYGDVLKDVTFSMGLTYRFGIGGYLLVAAMGAYIVFVFIWRKRTKI